MSSVLNSREETNSQSLSSGTSHPEVSEKIKKFLEEARLEIMDLA
jgi:hypothetical protein